MERTSGQQNENHILRNTSLRLPINIKGKIVWRENRYLVFRNHDVLDAGGVESVQDHKGRWIDKNFKR